MYEGSKFIKGILTDPVRSLIIGIILISLGILFSNIPTMIASQDWPSTAGRITSRRLVGVKFEEYDGDYHTEINGYIRYEYTVDEETYSSTVVNSSNAPFYPSAIVSQYSEGKDVLVYYNPRDPSRAVLEPGLVFSSGAIGFFPSLLMVAGLFFLGREAWFLIKRK